MKRVDERRSSTPNSDAACPQGTLLLAEVSPRPALRRSDPRTPQRGATTLPTTVTLAMLAESLPSDYYLG